MRVIRQKPMTLGERLYIFEAIRGLWTTLKHAARGLFDYDSLPTISYPEGQPEGPAACVLRLVRLTASLSRLPRVTIPVSKSG